MTRTDLVAESFDRVGTRTNPDDSGVNHGSGEVGVFREKPVAGVNGVCAGSFGGGEDFCNDKVRVGARRAVQTDGLVGESDVLRIDVLVRVDRDGRDTRVLGGANHANGDFTTVGDEELGDAC